MLPAFCLLLALASPAHLPDTLYTRGQKIACTVKEVSPELIRYVYPGEEAINTIYPRQVEKIVFASGRVQMFSNAQTQAPSKPDQWQKVRLTQLDQDVRGMISIGEVSATAKGGTIFSGTQRIRERAERKIKMQAAMLGASTILLNRTNKQDIHNTTPVLNTEKTAADGYAYVAEVLSRADLISKIGEKKTFTSTEALVFANSEFETLVQPFQLKLSIDQILEEPGKTILLGEMEPFGPGRFRLTYLNQSSFYVQFRNNHKIYSVEFAY